MNIELNVSGMTCGHCKAAVEKALKNVNGVADVNINLEAGKAQVKGENVSLEALVAAVTEEGYTARVAGA
ncbi:MAG: heavy-metal-associated domain-containing protein [Pleurocapsa sp. SU_196_0]|nr:heavy-metal-associated domain-containing protein [Pleurocapsa sp. SU_196_0]